MDGEIYHEKMVDNTYQARLKRLKEELNGPSVTEIIQMHKENNNNHSFDGGIVNEDDVLEEPPQIHSSSSSSMSPLSSQSPKNSTTNSLNSNTMPLDQSFDRDR